MIPGKKIDLVDFRKSDSVDVLFLLVVFLFSVLCVWQARNLLIRPLFWENIYSEKKIVEKASKLEIVCCCINQIKMNI